MVEGDGSGEGHEAALLGHPAPAPHREMYLGPNHGYGRYGDEESEQGGGTRDIGTERRQQSEDVELMAPR
jgi:hypothetical protein